MELTTFVDGLVHEPTQTEGSGLDLTVDAIRRVREPGRVDFGGGELEPAVTEPVETERRDPDDDYGWWSLAGDVYLLEYNEALSIPADRSVVLQPRDAVLARGAFHPTLHLGSGDSVDGIPLSVGGAGLRVKENARLSTLRPA